MCALTDWVQSASLAVARLAQNNVNRPKMLFKGAFKPLVYNAQYGRTREVKDASMQVLAGTGVSAPAGGVTRPHCRFHCSIRVCVCSSTHCNSSACAGLFKTGSHKKNELVRKACEKFKKGLRNRKMRQTVGSGAHVVPEDERVRGLLLLPSMSSWPTNVTLLCLYGAGSLMITLRSSRMIENTLLDVDLFASLNTAYVGIRSGFLCLSVYVCVLGLSFGLPQWHYAFCVVLLASSSLPACFARLEYNIGSPLVITVMTPCFGSYILRGFVSMQCILQ